MPPVTPAARSRPRKKSFSFFKLFVWLFVLGTLAAAAGIAGVLLYYSRQLPDFSALTDYKPSLITKVYDRNGRVLAEYARERRVWVPIGEIPKPVYGAFLAAEDAHFFEHGGYDLKAIARATIMNALTDRTQGASTITQQVAKTFLLSSERTYTRKIKELILSWRIEQVYSKNEILELYLNRIYLGNGAYGVAAAAQTYFSKDLKDLTVPERAMLAGLPQAPSRYNPVRNPKAAKARRDIVLRRMYEEHMITQDEMKAAQATDLGLHISPLPQGEDAPHFAEAIRLQLEHTYGTEQVYNAGLQVTTTLDMDLQQKAQAAVMDGLRSYDHRHGWRGPLKHMDSLNDWEGALDDVADIYAPLADLGEPAVVLAVSPAKADIGLSGGVRAALEADGVKWTNRGVKGTLKVGDVILVSKRGKKGAYMLEQVPAAQAALVALDVRSGEVLAMVGGLGSGEGFNRATMAKRQPGSSFKPFVYAAALEKGYTPASTVLDAPIVFRSGDNEWKPQNYDHDIGGLTTLREGLERSRNLMTVRLAQDIGLGSIAEMAKRLGVSDPIARTDLSVALGSASLSLMDMTSAYSVFPRGGLYVKPSMLEEVQDAEGKVLERLHPACDTCTEEQGATPDKLPTPPAMQAERVMSPQHAYQMVSMLEGVIQRGTGYALRKIGRPLAGKTGTTNDYVDAWFVGFSPTMAVGVWVGKDTPATLGSKETGAMAAAPIWGEFVENALKGKPVENFAVPDGIQFTTIDRDTGLLPGPGTTRTVTEAFMPGTAPTTSTPTADQQQQEDKGTLDQIFNAFGVY